ncbi:MAG: NAD(P)H-dependent oxidoreductase [Candidatus Pacebacteria bacterium]|nr:NAD(P)H-dependent oxidoreductase [Candidatus Paceibacterota bacterium]
MSKKIIAISGSLRKDSYNTAVLQEVRKTVPDLEIVDISKLPFFNEELEGNFPAEATTLKQKIEAADGIIISTPEYNRSISGVLKNAIDWASRPWGKNSFENKKVLVMGASVGPIGTALAQYDLKKIMLYLGAHVVPVEVYVNTAGSKFTDGKLTDENTKKHIADAVDRLLKL